MKYFIILLLLFTIQSHAEVQTNLSLLQSDPPLGGTPLPKTCTDGQGVTWNSTTLKWDTCASVGGGSSPWQDDGTTVSLTNGEWWSQSQQLTSADRLIYLTDPTFDIGFMVDCSGVDCSPMFVGMTQTAGARRGGLNINVSTTDIWYNDGARARFQNASESGLLIPQNFCYGWDSSNNTVTTNFFEAELCYDGTNTLSISDSKYLTVDQYYTKNAQNQDPADTGDGNPQTLTLNPNSNVVIVTCIDADSTDVTMGETDTNIRTVTIINDGAQVCDFADTAGVSELAGAFAMGQNDSLVLTYIGTTWVEVSRSNN